MPFAALRIELLAARDRRQRALQQVLALGWPATVTLALNIPGADKLPAGSRGLFDWARRTLDRRLPGAREAILRLDELGLFALFTTGREATAAKYQCVAIESGPEFARLVDIDVYDRRGRQIARSALGLPQRTCLLCARPAVECIRLGVHPPEDLLERTHELLAPFTG
jgi:holo-ACP synthase